MNIIALGLKYLRKELEKSKDPIVMNSMEVVGDLENATEVAVEILDDILTYEKLTSHILELEKSVVNVKDLIKETVRPFNTQVLYVYIFITIIFYSNLCLYAICIYFVGFTNGYKFEM